MKNYVVRPGTMKNQPGTMKIMKTDLEPWKTMKTDLDPWKTDLEPWITMKTAKELDLRPLGKVLIFRDRTFLLYIDSLQN